MENIILKEIKRKSNLDLNIDVFLGKYNEGFNILESTNSTDFINLDNYTQKYFLKEIKEAKDILCIFYVATDRKDKNFLWKYLNERTVKYFNYTLSSSAIL